MAKMKIAKPIDATYQTIKEVLEQARSQSYRAVNIAMVQAYWNIGRIIVEEEQRGKTKAGYGEYLLQELSTRLARDFGKGFDESNLRYIRKFYAVYPIRDALRHELSWTHYRLLMRVEKESTRKFYLEECITGNWSTRQLERQINSFYYERLLASRDKKPVKVKKLRIVKHNGMKEKKRKSAHIDELALPYTASRRERFYRYAGRYRRVNLANECLVCYFYSVQKCFSSI
jgi:hypothetical protein